jgi:serine/threonine protein phosphatase PrpC
VLTVQTFTHRGLVRAVNEDAVLWDPDLRLLVIADGMGGHNAGEVASALAIDAVRGFFRKTATDHEITWPFGFNSAQSFELNRLATATRVANHQVYRAAEERAEYGGMGTTIVAATFHGHRLSYSSVGDSRLYVFRGTELRQLTRDDSWVVMLGEEAKIDAASLSRHPMRHVLTNVVGTRLELDVATGEIDLSAGDLIVMSTDGLHETISEDTMVAELRQASGLDAAGERLVAAALSAGGHDNISLILARYEA